MSHLYKGWVHNVCSGPLEELRESLPGSLDVRFRAFVWRITAAQKTVESMDHKGEDNNFGQAVGLWSSGAVVTAIFATVQSKPWPGNRERVPVSSLRVCVATE